MGGFLFLYSGKNWRLDGEGMGEEVISVRGRGGWIN
jgi:hypothetical protein